METDFFCWFVLTGGLIFVNRWDKGFWPCKRLCLVMRMGPANTAAVRGSGANKRVSQ